jgi:hypothetical protein
VLAYLRLKRDKIPEASTCMFMNYNKNKINNKATMQVTFGV